MANFLDGFESSCETDGTLISWLEAAENDWELRPQNVQQKLIQADLDFNVFMKLPDRCGD